MPGEDDRIRALIRLLAEEKPAHRSLIRTRLVDYGDQAVPLLMRAVHEEADTKDQASEILEEIRLNRLEERVALFYSGRHPDLEEGVFLLAELKFPEVEKEAYQLELDRLAYGLRSRLSERDRPERTVQIMQKVLYELEGFRGNDWNYYDPDNSFINRVLDRRTGIPISLAVVILLIARRISLPFYGIGMPGHFLVQYGLGDEAILIDPFRSGDSLDRKKILRTLKEQGVPDPEAYLRPVDARFILVRMVRNVMAIYYKQNEEGLVSRLTRWQELILQPSSST